MPKKAEKYSKYRDLNRLTNSFSYQPERIEDKGKVGTGWRVGLNPKVGV